MNWLHYHLSYWLLHRQKKDQEREERSHYRCVIWRDEGRVETKNKTTKKNVGLFQYLPTSFTMNVSYIDNFKEEAEGKYFSKITQYYFKIWD
jgi:hypothetical protein